LNVLTDLDNKYKLPEQALTKVVRNFGTLKSGTARELTHEEFNVKNQTALGKFLTLTVLLGSLGACASHSPYTSNSVNYAPVHSNVPGHQLGIILYNLGKYSSLRLSPEQKQKQTTAVYSALEGEYGDVYNWYEHTAMGSVKAVHGYPQGSGYCKVIYSTVTNKGSSRNFTETACKEAGHDGWRFIRK
jgi:surface antigen